MDRKLLAEAGKLGTAAVKLAYLGTSRSQVGVFGDQFKWIWGPGSVRLVDLGTRFSQAGGSGDQVQSGQQQTVSAPGCSGATAD